jgi:hypothetical protein
MMTSNPQNSEEQLDKVCIIGKQFHCCLMPCLEIALFRATISPHCVVLTSIQQEAATGEAPSRDSSAAIVNAWITLRRR